MDIKGCPGHRLDCSAKHNNTLSHKYSVVSGCTALRKVTHLFIQSLSQQTATDHLPIAAIKTYTISPSLPSLCLQAGLETPQLVLQAARLPQPPSSNCLLPHCRAHKWGKSSLSSSWRAGCKVGGAATFRKIKNKSCFLLLSFFFISRLRRKGRRIC